MRPVGHNRHYRVRLISHWREPEKEGEDGDIAVVPRETFSYPTPEKGLGFQSLGFRVWGLGFRVKGASRNLQRPYP
jgi:hypothetical protein